MEIPRPHRIVFMIDLAPLLVSTTNPNEYITAILKSAAKILSFAPLSTSLFAFKLFFSSLSPIISTSRVRNVIGKSATFLSFDFPLPTALSLSKTLNSIQFRAQHAEFRPTTASLLVESLVQLGLECCWDQNGGGEGEGEGGGGLWSGMVNLVLLFSKFPSSLDRLVEFLGGDRLMVKDDSFVATFSHISASANTIFGSRDVHLSWIGVGHEKMGCGEEDMSLSRLLRRVIMGVGWGFCSTDEIVLGSAFVPFGMIFPSIGYDLGFALSDCGSKGRVELCLEISDASGKPLKCKCCDLEILHLKSSKQKWDTLMFRSSDSSSNVTATICVKEVWKSDERVNIDAEAKGLVLLREFSRDRRSAGGGDTDTSGEFVGDKILQLLCPEWCSFTVGRPVWQVILSFLYRRNLWALVSVYGGDGCSLIGIIKPFTVHAALLYIFDTRPVEFRGIHSISERDGSKSLGEKGSKSKKGLANLCNMSWSSLQTSVYSQTDNHIGLGADLEEVCFAKGCNISKKMRFLQCWMKQMKKSHYCLQTKTDIPKNELNAIEGIEERLIVSPQKTEPPASSSSTGLPDFISQSELEKLSLFDGVGDLDFFDGGICQKIECGLCFEGVDLGNLAERLVEMAIRGIYMKFKNNIPEDLAIEATQDDTHDLEVINEVMKALLVKPKDLAAKYKDSNLLATAPNINSTASCLSKKVKEHELQIMFRMEILRSSVGTRLEDNTRGKFVKEICSLLENIEFNLQGGMFAGESLIDFSERTIKARYSHCLEDVICRIYTQMEFLSFDGDDEEDSCPIPNSNTNNGDETPLDRENNPMNKQDKTSIDKSCDPSQKANNNPKDSQNECQLLKAQERRERARRFSHFTSKMQNLQRVWAPKKQSKADRSMHNSMSNQLERKRRRTSNNDMVLETPMKVHHSAGKEGQGEHGYKLSFQKALFGDEDKSHGQCD